MKIFYHFCCMIIYLCIFAVLLVIFKGIFFKHAYALLYHFQTTLNMRTVFNIFLNSTLSETYSGLKSAFLHVEHFHKAQLIDPLPSYCTFTRRFYKSGRFSLNMEGGTSLIIQKKLVRSKPVFLLKNIPVNDSVE